MLNYRLCVRELLILKLAGFKDTIQGYLMFIGQLTDEDPRKKNPSIKNVNAIHSMRLSATDYKNIKIYIHNIRSQNALSDFLFLTEQRCKPYPISHLVIYYLLDC
ncbi:hypothetical protein B0180_06950 [Moraxella canis]|uniref:Uncharacterized protein n=1 Tax=Moraxella canis TaxID=90239 RepID=A0A1S9ZIB6_9GAMM|nr:hypothetical protein B0180_06950 [Moraxella canis]